MTPYRPPTDNDLLNLQARADVLRRAAYRFIRPLCIETAAGPNQVGSCVLLQIGSYKFVATAAHVLDHAFEGPLWLGADGSFVPINGTMFRTGGRLKRHEDIIDIGFVEIKDEVAASMGECRFFSPEHCDIVDSPAPDAVYTACGFPIRHTVLDYVQKKHKPELISYSLSMDHAAYGSFSLIRGAHLALEFQMKRMRSGVRIRRPRLPKGISGGAIFRLRGAWNADDPFGATLVGIITEIRKTPRSVLIGTRIGLHLESIANEFPTLRDFLPPNPHFTVTAARRE